MTGAIGQRWQVVGSKVVVEIIDDYNVSFYKTKVVYSTMDNRDSLFELGSAGVYFRDRFTDSCSRSDGPKFEYLAGQDKPKE